MKRCYGAIYNMKNPMSLNHLTWVKCYIPPWLCSSTRFSKCSKFGFDRHLNCCGCYSAYSQGNNLASSKLAFYSMDEMESTMVIKFTTEDINDFQSQAVLMLLKENIWSQCNSYDAISSFIFFWSEKKLMPKPPKGCSTYSHESINPSICNISTEWKTVHNGN